MIIIAWNVAGASAGDPSLRCEKAAATQLGHCVRAARKAESHCYETTGGACEREGATTSRITKLLLRTGAKVVRRCGNDATVQSVGYGPLLTAESLGDRITYACASEAESLASRAFGGPQGAALAKAATPEVAACLATAHEEGGRWLDEAYLRRSKCIVAQHKSGSCDVSRTEARVARRREKSAARIAAACDSVATQGLRDLVALDVEQFLDRAEEQSRCMLATAHAETEPFDLDCGPRAGVPVPARATPTRVILDESVWGTRCGDGSPYAFWIRLAPAGAPVENVLIHLQGGGVCFLASDCSGVSPGLFRALDNTFTESGYMRNDPSINPFGDWTKVYLPYCTQDVFAGGGATSDLGSLTVERYGAINVRAALRYVRDVLWAEMDATTEEGYRGDRLRVLFGGNSAGGFGASYNYHYLLDDLQWARTTAVPNAGLGLDNGGSIGVATLGTLFLGDSGPLGWRSRQYLPPYCFDASCAIIPNLHTATSARLGTVPEQQILSVSNQVDNTQVGTTLFPSTVAWIDALRDAYCATRGLPGLGYYLPARTSSIHTITATNTWFPSSMTSDGITIGDWLGDAIADPASTVDAVEEGTLVDDFGAQPFPCPVD